MVKYKGHSILEQYVKKQPIKWEFKIWCPCAAKLDYLYEFYLFTGKKNGHIKQRLGEIVVLSLAVKLIHSNCEIFWIIFLTHLSCSRIC